MEQKKNSKEVGEFWDDVESQRALSLEEMEQKGNAAEDYKRCALFEETSGDKNLERFG